MGRSKNGRFDELEHFKGDSGAQQVILLAVKGSLNFLPGGGGKVASSILKPVREVSRCRACWMNPWRQFSWARLRHPKTKPGVILLVPPQSSS